jgi:hypothetical protein
MVKPNQKLSHVIVKRAQHQENNYKDYLPDEPTPIPSKNDFTFYTDSRFPSLSTDIQRNDLCQYY